MPRREGGPATGGTTMGRAGDGRDDDGEGRRGGGDGGGEGRRRGELNSKKGVLWKVAAGRSWRKIGFCGK